MKNFKQFNKRFRHYIVFGFIGLSFMAFPFFSKAVVKLNPIFAENGNASSIRLALATEDKRVVYIADPGALGIFELFSVPAGGGISTVISGPLIIGGQVIDVRVTADGKQAVFIADKEVDEKLELYSVSTTGSNLVKLTSFPDNNRDIASFKLTPDGLNVVYISDELVDDKNELFSVGINGSGKIRINAIMPDDRDVSDFKISANSSRVVYQANRDNILSFELYSVTVVGPGFIKLNPNLNANQNVTDFQIDALSSNVVYRADQDNDNVFELYAVPITGGVTTKINPPLIGDISANDFDITPDGSQVVYIADKDIIGQEELYVSPITGGGIFTKLTALLNPFSDVFSAKISPDGKYVVYRADQDVDNQAELYSRVLNVVFAQSVKISPPLVSIASDVRNPIQFSADSQFVFYRADQDVLNENELYRVAVKGGNVTQISTPLITGGDLIDYQLNPNRPSGDQLVYLAKQDAINRIEVYSIGFEPLSDFDGDGKNDILLKQGKTLSFLSRNIQNVFELKNIITPLLSSQKVDAVNDLNGDTRPELVLRKGNQISVATVKTDLQNELSQVVVPVLEPKFFFKASGRINGEQILITAKGSKKLKIFYSTNEIAHTNSSAFKVVGFGEFQGFPSILLKQNRLIFAQPLIINSNQVNVGAPFNIGKLPKKLLAKGSGYFLNANENVELVASKGKKIHILPLPIDTNIINIAIFTNNSPVKVVGPK